MIAAAEQARRDRGEPKGAINFDEVDAMLEQAGQLLRLVGKANVVLEGVELASQEQLEAVVALRNLPRSDDRLPQLRHVLESFPNLDLIVSIVDEPAIAGRAVQARAEVSELREHLFFSDGAPATSEMIGSALQAVLDGKANDEDRGRLETLRSELGRAADCAVAVVQLALAIGAHSARWNSDPRWRRARVVI